MSVKMVSKLDLKLKEFKGILKTKSKETCYEILK